MNNMNNLRTRPYVVATNILCKQRKSCLTAHNTSQIIEIVCCERTHQEKLIVLFLATINIFRCLSRFLPILYERELFIGAKMSSHVIEFQ